MGSTLNRVNLLHFLASQGMNIDPGLGDEDWDGDGDGDGDGTGPGVIVGPGRQQADLPECGTQ
jgi:hypothetical protein